MEITKKVEAETVRHIALREQLSAKTSWFGYGLQGLVVWIHAPSYWVLVWVATAAFFEGVNLVVARKVLQDPIGSGRAWLQRLPLTLFISALAWGSLVFVPGAVSGADIMMINLLALAVVAIFSVHNLCLYPRALLAFSAGLGLPVVMYYLSGAGNSLMLGLGAIALVLMIQLYGHSTRQLIVDGMVARFSQEVTAQQLEQRNTELAQALEAIRELANTDPMTHCLNRRAGLECMGSEKARFERHGVPFGIILIDVDHFKQVNDTYGHTVGDAVLITFSERLRAGLRSKVDHLVRWGGEEFLCVVTACDQASLIAKAESLRAAVAASPLGQPLEELPITASMGVAVYRAGDSIDITVDRADKALYRAKHNGRNRVECDGLQRVN